MGTYLGKIRIEPVGNGLWKVCIAFSYISNKGERIDIPEGFIFDGASIPRFLWSVVGHPLEQIYLAAACIHDYLYVKQYYTRRRSDGIFLEAMRDKGVAWLRRTMMWLAVRIFGREPWENYKKLT